MFLWNIYHFNILFIGCTLPLQENITVYKVSLKNFDFDFDRPKMQLEQSSIGF